MDANNSLDAARKDVSIITAGGRSKAPLIHGVVIRPATTHTDARGSLCEILNPAWGLHPAPIAFVYQFTIRPGMAKGWHLHKLHDDRLFLSLGHVKAVLYDTRPESPTYGMINEIVRSEHHRTVMIVPAFVFHAHQNVGTTDALIINMPTCAYDHEDPDVYRLPLDTELIPYKFDNRIGW